MIYIHIGKPKTGTTTIQRFLHLNRFKLREQNCLYPDAGLQFEGHHNIYYDITYNPKYNPSAGSFKQLLERMNEFMIRKSDGSIILSSETFSTLGEVMWEKFINQIEKIDDYRIIIYLRDQVSYLKSFWAMHVDSGKTNYSLLRWASNMIETNLVGTDYYLNLEQIRKVVGREKMIVVNYNEIAKEDFISYFLSICNFEGMDSLDKLDYVSHNTSSLNEIEIPDELFTLCEARFTMSNKLVAIEYLDKSYLFES